MNTFTDKIVVVSGATRGIGRAIARSFLQEGAFVYGLYAGNEESARAFKQECENHKENLEIIRCNVSDESQVKALFTQIEHDKGRVDIVVNSAGIRKDAVLAMMDSDKWQQVIDTNLTGTYLMSKYATLLMMQNKYGRIINITSPVAQMGFAGQSNYAASKAGQIAMTKSLSKEVAKKKITVNCVSPGFIDTDFIAELPKEQLAEYKKMVPMKRFGKPKEVASTVLFLASDAAAYITGATIEITGGL